jgi:hypothetical protein
MCTHNPGLGLQPSKGPLVPALEREGRHGGRAGSVARLPAGGSDRHEVQPPSLPTLTFLPGICLQLLPPLPTFPTPHCQGQQVKGGVWRTLKETRLPGPTSLPVFFYFLEGWTDSSPFVY